MTLERYERAILTLLQQDGPLTESEIAQRIRGNADVVGGDLFDLHLRSLVMVSYYRWAITDAGTEALRARHAG